MSWTPVAGKPNILVHADRPECEVEIYKLECEVCGIAGWAYYAACECEDHAHGEHDYEAHETHCGQRMTRLMLGVSDEWPKTKREQEAEELERALAEEAERDVLAGSEVEVERGASGSDPDPVGTDGELGSGSSKGSL